MNATGNVSKSIAGFRCVRSEFETIQLSEEPSMSPECGFSITPSYLESQLVISVSIRQSCGPPVNGVAPGQSDDFVSNHGPWFFPILIIIALGALAAAGVAVYRRRYRNKKSLVKFRSKVTSAESLQEFNSNGPIQPSSQSPDLRDREILV